MVDLLWDRNFALEQSCDDEEILAELLETMRRSAAKDLAKIKEGLVTGNADQVEHSAHSMKGASASLGFGSIRQVAMEIEYAARSGNLDLATKAADLETMVEQLGTVK